MLVRGFLLFFLTITIVVRPSLEIVDQLLDLWQRGFEGVERGGRSIRAPRHGSSNRTPSGLDQRDASGGAPSTAALLTRREGLRPFLAARLVLGTSFPGRAGPGGSAVSGTRPSEAFRPRQISRTPSLMAGEGEFS